VANVHDETWISRQINLVSNTMPVLEQVAQVTKLTGRLAAKAMDVPTLRDSDRVEGGVHDRDCMWARPAQLPGPVGQAKGQNGSFVFWPNNGDLALSAAFFFRKRSRLFYSCKP